MTFKVKANLLSVSEMVHKGNKVVFDRNGCSIYDEDNQLVVYCKQKDGVYKIQSNQPKYLTTRAVTKGKGKLVLVRESEIERRPVVNINRSSNMKEDGKIPNQKVSTPLHCGDHKVSNYAIEVNK